MRLINRHLSAARRHHCQRFIAPGLPSQRLGAGEQQTINLESDGHASTIQPLKKIQRRCHVLADWAI
jgi:hypothetical protein